MGLKKKNHSHSLFDNRPNKIEANRFLSFSLYGLPCKYGIIFNILIDNRPFVMRRLRDVLFRAHIGPCLIGA